MANNIIEKFIQIKADIADASKEIKGLFDEMLEKQKLSLDEQIKINEQLENAGKSAKNAEKGVQSMTKGFKGMGLAIKAMGVGLLLEAFQVLKDVFMSNQKVVDALATTMGSLKIVFNDLFKYIEKNVGPITDYFKGIFENPQKAIEDFGNMIKDNLIERFNSFIKTLGHVGSAVKKLFTGDFKGAMQEGKNAAKELVDVATGVNNSFDRTVQAAKDAADAIANYAKETWNSAAAMVEMENRVKIALALNAGLVEEYDRLAEKQRQLRDDESASISDRIKANNELGNVLEKQKNAMIANADLAIQSAQMTLSQNNSIENQVALIQAQNEKKAILAQIEGFASEQIVNRIALEKELNELNQTAIDGIATRTIEERKFADSLIKDNTDRLDAQRQTIQAEYDLELTRLNNKKALYKEGTQAYADAQEEILNLTKSNSEAILTNERELKQTLSDEKAEGLARIIEDDALTFETRFLALDEQLAQINATEYESEEARTQAIQDNTDARIALAEAEAESKKKTLGAVGDALGMASKLAGENTAAGKGLAIAGATISTYQSAVDSYKGMVSAIPGPVGIAAGAVAAAASVATGLATVKKILSVKIPGASAGAGGGGSAPSAPSFNIVGQSSENQLSGTIASQQVEPIKAYVTGGDVSSQQALDRNILNNSTFV